jgi:hypothetical protein
MYRYQLQNPETGAWRVVTAREFRATLPRGETIRRLKRRHWVGRRRQDAEYRGDPRWNRGIARGPRSRDADF